MCAKISRLNSKRLPKKTAKIVRGYFILPHPVLAYNTTVRKRHAARCSPGPIYPVKEVMFSPALVSLLVNKITQKLFNIFPQNSAERWLVGYRRNHQIFGADPDYMKVWL